MGKYRDHRQPRGQGYDRDRHPDESEPSYFDRKPSWASQPSSAATSAAQDAEVVWLNVDKGFGFLKLSDGSDAFIHLSKLRAAGHESLPDGTPLKVRTEAGQKGLQVVEVVSVDLAAGAARPEPVARPASRPSHSPDGGDMEGSGIVKRYDQAKGFGFIGMDSGGKDVFVHASVLNRSGLTALEAGQKVFVTYAQGQKGLEVRSIRLL